MSTNFSDTIRDWITADPEAFNPTGDLFVEGLNEHPIAIIGKLFRAECHF